MPVALFRSYAAGLERTRAAELLALHGVIAAGTGSLRKGDAQRLLRDLQRAAASGTRPKPATPEDLAAIGIALIPAAGNA